MILKKKHKTCRGRQTIYDFQKKKKHENLKGGKKKKMHLLHTIISYFIIVCSSSVNFNHEEYKQITKNKMCSFISGYAFLSYFAVKPFRKGSITNMFSTPFYLLRKSRRILFLRSTRSIFSLEITHTHSITLNKWGKGEKLNNKSMNSQILALWSLPSLLVLISYQTALINSVQV